MLVFICCACRTNTFHNTFHIGSCISGLMHNAMKHTANLFSSQGNENAISGQ